jgi:hypothetical protein
MSKEESQKFVKGLQKLAKFYINNPEFELPGNISTYIYNCNKETVSKFIHAFKGIAKKTYYGSTLYVEFPFEKITLTLLIGRDQVCKKTMVKQMVKERKTIQEAVYKEVEVEKEVESWECPASIFEESKH